MLIDKLKKEQALTKEEWVELIEGRNADLPNISSHLPAKNGTTITITTYTSGD